MSRIPLNSLLKIDPLDLLMGSTPLPTTAQTATGAIAELKVDIDSLDLLMGSTPLPTTAQTATGAIAEIDAKESLAVTSGTDGIVQSNGRVTFSGVDDSTNNMYDLYCSRVNVAATVYSVTGAGTNNMTIIYQTTGAQTGDTCALKITKH